MQGISAVESLLNSLTFNMEISDTHFLKDEI